MGLLEMITDEEQALMLHQVKHYAMSNGDYADLSAWNINHILREWGWAKGQHLAKMFGDSLILRKHIQFNKDADEIAEELDNLEYPNCFDVLMRKFDAATRLLDNHMWHYDDDPRVAPECLTTLDLDTAYEVRRVVYNLCSNWTLARNVYNGATIEIPTPSGKSIKVNRGCRAIKTIGKLIDAFGLDMAEFENYRIKHSQTLNQKKLEGDLCISIHPLDYVTMSDNDSGWESCMSWENQGCYRQGTVEMMNSPYVVVAYLEASNPMKFHGGLEWNNKKWRELYIVSSDFITNVKGYPYCNANLTSEVLRWLRDLAETNDVFHGRKYLPKVYHWGSDDGLPDELDEELHVSIHCECNYMYNDFGHAFQYCMVKDTVGPGDRLAINYSGSAECMVCGELDPSFISESDAVNLACQRCDNYMVCSCCGEVVNHDEYTMVGDEIVCSYCMDEYYVYDMVEEESIHRDESIQIYICNEDGTKYADDWQLAFTTSRWVDPSLITTGELIHHRVSSLWSNRIIYLIKVGTWTKTFLDALSYNICDTSEQAIYEILEDTTWRDI